MKHQQIKLAREILEIVESFTRGLPDQLKSHMRDLILQKLKEYHEANDNL